MIYPTNRFLYLVFVPLFGAIFLLPLEIAAGPSYAWISGRAIVGLLILDGALLALFVLEALTLPRRRRFSAGRKTDPVYSIHYPHGVELDIIYRGSRSLSTIVKDDWSEPMSPEGFPDEVRIQTGVNRIGYRLRINDRGMHKMEKAHITVFSTFGFVRRIYRVPCPSEIRVYPDLKAISKYLLLARKSHLGLLGIRRAMKGGGDTEFERLREYQRDDEFRHMDWKATARQSRMIVRTYQMNQNQTVSFLVDCGRMMTAEVKGRTLLDYALNSILLLSRVALGQGDRVGFTAFDSSVHRFVKPAIGPGHHRRLVRAAYDLFPSHRESNFDQAFHHLNAYSRKRSLVILITNVIDEMNAETIRSYLGGLSGRHLPFAILLKQRDVEEMVSERPTDPDGFYVQAAAADFLTWKARTVQSLTNSGVLVLEAFPDNLDTEMINRYLMIKARKLL